MPTPWQRDLERDRANLTRWLGSRLPEASGLRVSDLKAPQSSGFSNDTLLFDLSYEQDGSARHEPLVVRIQPTGFQVFPEYDMGLQYRTMQRLAETDVLQGAKGPPDTATLGLVRDAVRRRRIVAVLGALAVALFVNVLLHVRNLKP